MTEEIREFIGKYVKQQWNPEEITGCMEKEGVIKLHYETIYQYILSDKQNGGELYRHFGHQDKMYRKRYGAAQHTAVMEYQ